MLTLSSEMFLVLLAKPQRKNSGSSYPGYGMPTHKISLETDHSLFKVHTRSANNEMNEKYGIYPAGTKMTPLQSIQELQPSSFNAVLLCVSPGLG